MPESSPQFGSTQADRRGRPYPVSELSFGSATHCAAQEQLELEAQMMFPAAFQQHTSNALSASSPLALATVPPAAKPGEWQCPRCRHVGSGARPTCIKCGERKQCPFGMECLRETCWFQHPPGYNRTLAVQRNAAKRIVTVEGGYSANTPLSVTHQAHFADPNRGKIGGGITKPIAGPAVRSDMPVSDGRAHASASKGGADDSAEAASAPKPTSPAAAALTPGSASPRQGTSTKRVAGIGEACMRQEAAARQRQADAPAEIVKEVVPVPAHCVPRLIGKGGTHVKVRNYTMRF